MSFLLNKYMDEIIGGNWVEGVWFNDSSKIVVDLVVMVIGVRLNVNLVKKSGIEINRVIIVNDYLEMSILDIYVVGECVEYWGMIYGFVVFFYE